MNNEGRVRLLNCTPDTPPIKAANNHKILRLVFFGANSANTRLKPFILGALGVNTSQKEVLTPQNGVLTDNKSGVNRETLINSGFAAEVNTVNTVNTKKNQP